MSNDKLEEDDYRSIKEAQKSDGAHIAIIYERLLKEYPRERNAYIRDSLLGDAKRAAASQCEKALPGLHETTFKSV